MLGLFGALDMGARSLQTQQMGVEVAGHNLANVNNPAYARQRLQIQTAPPLQTSLGSEGTGANVTSIQQLRDSLVDGQIVGETSVGGYWTASQSALQSAQAGLGEYINEQTQGVNATNSAGAGDTLGTDLNALFSSFQDLATSPSSMSVRQAVLAQASTLASRFNQVSQQLSSVRSGINTSLTQNVTSANQLLTDIAGLNAQISNAQSPNAGPANDLLDLRQQKLEALSNLVSVSTSTGSDGSVSISVGGVQLVSGRQVLDTMQTYDAGGGQLLVKTATGGLPLSLGGGAMQGAIDTRDGALATLQTQVNGLAAALINGVNTIHRAGFSLTGSTGVNFFTGTDASTIAVNTTLAADPSLLQAAGAAGAPGDNTVALELAQLPSVQQISLNGQTLSGAYSSSVAGLGQALSSANNQLSDSTSVQAMLTQQRNSVSGVSLDEEMTNLMQFQQAYAASARFVSTIATMLDTTIAMKT